ncbi:N-acetyltransferase [Paenibacillus sp. N3/727]|uniref:N-acetyltransferase n=1 Tax=Paenibacillus sp. N3/727 TaxID=2925845 RepID=UPI001F52B9C3|nr:N-acetyltransferase [Paenibacillus sp. N3/727]UNK16225.1 N-acetyltransferase [Paenibacillus sp. N3/727]
MRYVQITRDNLDQVHICCALGAKQYEQAVREKKHWLRERMEDGLTFYRLDDRAKVFIEYLPAEKAWVPIEAPNYMYINCLWVSGRHKDSGHGRQLLNKCKEDAMALGMDGIVHLVSKKKLPYLSDKRYFEHMGFTIVDQADPYFELAVLKWNDQAVMPTFGCSVKDAFSVNNGITVYYTAQCPFAVGIIEDLEKVASEQGMDFASHRLNTREEARKAPSVWTTFCMLYNGKFITHEIMSPNKFEKLLLSLSKESS